jgi:hypothetical protein
MKAHGTESQLDEALAIDLRSVFGNPQGIQEGSLFFHVLHFQKL